jgi:hypothetical protein
VAFTQEEFPSLNVSVANAALLQSLKVSSKRFGAVTLPPAAGF